MVAMNGLVGGMDSGIGWAGGGGGNGALRNGALRNEGCTRYDISLISIRKRM